MTFQTQPHVSAQLPLSHDGYYLTDGGIETTLIFHDGLELPLFAAFVLLETEEGRAALTQYFERHIGVAQNHGLGFILESPTWRASSDWGTELGYSVEEMARFNSEAIYLMRTLKKKYETSFDQLLISGCVGPRGDGYVPGQLMTVNEAEEYHFQQIEALAKAGSDMVTAITMNNVPESIGITKAAQRAGIPVVISLTVETDGALPTGQSLAGAIGKIDGATSNGPAYYMINCAHPDHFEDVLGQGDDWLRRIGGVRANASRMSHSELDESETLDDGDPHELGHDYRRLIALLPNLRVLGGCCGTDHRHVDAMGHAVKAA